MGVVEPCGLGEPIPTGGTPPAEDMRSSCKHNNDVLLEQLRADEFEESLMQQTRADACLGRMTEPVTGMRGVLICGCA